MREFRFASLCLAAGLAFNTAGQARVGESKAECVARYGEPVATQPSKFEKSDPEADVFEFSGIKVIVEYLAGEAWVVSYADRKMNQTNADKILANYSEATGAKWEGPTKFAGSKHWNDTKGERHAVLYESPLYKLVVFGKKAVGAKWKPVVFTSEMEEPAETEEPEEDAASRRKPAPTTKDPFSGF